MTIFSVITGLVLAAYSMILLDIYTRLSARARERSNDILRFFLFIVLIPLLFAPAFLAMGYAQKMFFSEPSAISAAKHHSSIIIMVVWLGLVWGFIIARWRILTARVRAT